MTKFIQHFSGEPEELFSHFVKNHPTGIENIAFFLKYYSGVTNFSFVNCKESFNILLWKKEYRTEEIVPDFIFIFNYASIDTFIEIMNRLHKAWKLPKFSYVIKKCNNNILIYVKNKFWRQNVAHTEVLSILAKGVNRGHIVLSQNDNELFTVCDNLYFNENTLHLFKVGKEFVKHFYGLDRIQDHDQIYAKLFSFGCKGLINSLSQVRRLSPTKFTA